MISHRLSVFLAALILPNLASAAPLVGRDLSPPIIYNTASSDSSAWTTTFCLVNYSTRNITSLNIWGVDSADASDGLNPITDFPEDSWLAPDASFCRIVMVDTIPDLASPSETPIPTTFEMDMTLDDGTVVHAQIDQADSWTSGYEAVQLDVLVSGSSGGSYAGWRTSGALTQAFILRDATQPDLSNFMANLLTANPDIKLNQITMVSAHDAGMYTASSCVSPASASQAVTQVLTTSQQLAAGVRYFDFRPYFYYNNPYIGAKTELFQLAHFSSSSILGSIGCFGAVLTDVLAQISDFLRGPGINETVIAYFSHPHSGGPIYMPEVFKSDPPCGFCSQYVVDNVLPLIMASLGDLVLKVPNGTVIADLPLSQTQGKVITAFSSDWSAYWNSEAGVIPWQFQGSPGAGLQVYDLYANSDNITTMMDDQLAKLQTYGGINASSLFLESWTLTGQTSDLLFDLASLSGRANGALGGGLLSAVRSGSVKRPNLVNLDFIDPWIGRAIVGLNNL